VTTRRTVILVLGLGALAVSARPADAQQTDVIRGQIVGADSQPLQGVRVRATSYQGNVAKTATTGKDGRFNILFLNGEGDYWIDLSRIGYRAKRFEIRKIGNEQVLIADSRMQEAAAALGAVNVRANGTRERPAQTGTAPDVSGGEKALVAAAVSPDQQGDLAAMAAAAGFQIIPGLDGASDAYSALGLSGDQNNTTFSGLGSGVTALPPDILATTSINPYPFDVSLGGFSGAQVTIQTIPGTNFSRRAVTTNEVLPPLEWGDESALAQGRQYTYGRLGGNGAGPIVPDKAFYNTAYNVARQFSDLHTLLNTSAVGLVAAGVSPDSAARLAGILRGAGIPVAREGLPGIVARDAAQLSGNIDFSPNGSGGGHSFTIGGAGNFNRTKPVGRGSLVLGTPSHSGETSSWGANAALTHANYFGFGILARTTLGVAASGSATSPDERLPEGSVRVASSLADGTTSVKPLTFGGLSSQSRQSTNAVQLTNSLAWFSADNHHSIKITASVLRDGFQSYVIPSAFGSYAYNSLADLDARMPASYTRTLNAAPRRGSQVSGAVSVGDSWRPTLGLQVQYGARLDGNTFLTHPAANAALRDALRVDNTAVPSRVYVSPRIGMQWHYGNSEEVQYAPGSARPPRAVIHAGVGVFQNIAGAQLIGGAVSATGLANSTQAIACIGDATPVPDWSAFLADPAAIPDRCADGSASNVFATSAPNVTMFSRGFRQPHSLRGAADWSGPVFDNRFVLGVQGILSAGRNQQGVFDINLDTVPRFRLADEHNRPVYVAPSAIVATTGAVAIAASRVTPAFQHVWQARSNLRLPSTQFTVNLKPITVNPYLHWEATYTLLDAHETYSGFASTAGNPFAIERGRTLQAGRNMLQLRWYDVPIHDLVYVTTYARFMSGARFTPSVAGDINGDGLANDRAFIADPSTIRDPSQRAAMTSLLARAPSSVRACLQRQLGVVAGRGSCQTPWTTNALVQVKLNPQKVRLPKRATVTLTISNPIALADLAVHGSGDLRGWGQNVPPDQNLLVVRGFDPVSRRYRYDVNQRFGSTRPQQSTTAQLPFVSFGVSIDVGVPRERQLLTQYLDIGRRDDRDRLAAAQFANFGKSSIPNPMGMILLQSDSLRLTRAQADSIADLAKDFGSFADSLWLPVGQYFAGLPASYSTADAFARYADARAKTVDHLITLVPVVKEILTPAQERRLPPVLANYLDVRVLKFLRTSTVGDATSLVRR
jgi:hypothetical protein